MQSVSLIDVWLEVTMSCNVRCHFCYNQFQAGGDTSAETANMSALAADGILTQLCSSWRIRTLTIAGGEPTASRDLLSIVAAARRRCQALILATNGTLLNDTLAARLVDQGVDTFQISISGGSPAVHDVAVSKPGAFHRLLAGAIAVRQNGGRLALVFVADDKNHDDLASVFDIAYLIGAEAVVVNEVRGGSENVSLQSDSMILERKREFAEMVRRASLAAERYAIPLIVPTYLPSAMEAELRQFKYFRYRHAQGGVPSIVIDPLGRARRCHGSSRLVGDVASVSPALVAEWDHASEECACAIERQRERRRGGGGSAVAPASA